MKEVDPETGRVRIVKLDVPTPQPHRAARAESARSALLVRSSQQPLARSVLRRAAAAAATATGSSATGLGPAVQAAAVTDTPASSSPLLSPASPPHPNVTVRSPGGTMRRRPLAPPPFLGSKEAGSDVVPPQSSSSLGPPLTDEELREALVTEAALGQRQQERLRLQRAAVLAALLGLADWAAQAPGAEAAGFGAMGRLAAAASVTAGRLVRGAVFGSSG